MSHEYVLVGGKKVEVGIIGTNGPVLVLLPGWTHDFQYETKFIEELSKNHKVITISYPGYLGSEENHKAMSMSFLAEIIDKVIKHLKLTDFKLLGFSMGCQVVLKYLDTYNKNIKAFLFSPTLNPLTDYLNLAQIRLIKIKVFLKLIRTSRHLKLRLVNLAYTKIGSVTEGSQKGNNFKSQSVSINGAFDTLIAMSTSFIDPLKYKDNVVFIFGDREILQNKLNGIAEYKVIKNAGHGAFHSHYKEIANMI